MTSRSITTSAVNLLRSVLRNEGRVGAKVGLAGLLFAAPLTAQGPTSTKDPRPATTTSAPLPHTTWGLLTDSLPSTAWHGPLLVPGGALPPRTIAYPGAILPRVDSASAVPTDSAETKQVVSPPAASPVTESPTPASRPTVTKPKPKTPVTSKPASVPAPASAAPATSSPQPDAGSPPSSRPGLGSAPDSVVSIAEELPDSLHTLSPTTSADSALRDWSHAPVSGEMPVVPARIESSPADLSTAGRAELILSRLAALSASGARALSADELAHAFTLDGEDAALLRDYVTEARIEGTPAASTLTLRLRDDRKFPLDGATLVLKRHVVAAIEPRSIRFTRGVDVKKWIVTADLHSLELVTDDGQPAVRASYGAFSSTFR